MNTKRFVKKVRRSCESGQAMILMLLIFSLVMLGAISFAIDMGMLWYHRQEAQTAADATCTAGAMDILVDASGSPTGHQGFTSGTSFDCQAHPTYPVCQYAARNGYDSKNTTPGNFVQVSFPSKAQVTGVPSAAVPGAALVPNAFMRVDITDRVPTWYSALLSGQTNRTVRAMAVCGTVLEDSPVPIVVLHPTQSGSLQANGAQGEIKILGGPIKSIEVNSGSTTAVTFGGTIDLSQGGPNYNGSQLGTWGGPVSPTGTFLPNASYWINHSAPINDPFANVPVPTQPAVGGPKDCNTPVASGGTCFPHDVAAGVNGCAITSGTCTEYAAGYYKDGICLGNSCKITFGSGAGKYTPQSVAIFDPGVYYLNGGIAFQDNGLARPSTAIGDGSGGTVFYLTGAGQKCSGQTGLVCAGSNTGTGGTPSGGTAFSITKVQCPGGAAVDPNLLTVLTANGYNYNSIKGNLLLAPCTGTYGDQLGTGQYRGLLFFGDRSSNVGAGWGGGGGSLLAGSLYVHQTSGNAGHLQLQGGSCSSSYVLGEIVVDSIGMGGNPCINMVLNPSKTSSILKASLLPWSSTN
jgi:hypothetical protein